MQSEVSVIEEYTDLVNEADKEQFIKNVASIIQEEFGRIKARR